MRQNTGIIVKSSGGFYYVKCGDAVYECRARGIFRKKGISPLVGDRVKILADGEKGVVDEILPRRNALCRPPVANIDQLVIVASAASPPPDPYAIDRLTAFAQTENIDAAVIFSKSDLADVKGLVDTYCHAGFACSAVSNVTGEGLERVRRLLTGKVSAFTGNSGVGKSSLLNELCPQLGLTVGAVSRKLGRGRQTTRTVELFELPQCGPESYAADTPGFSSFESDTVIRADNLPSVFREFAPYLGKCRFTGCCHVNEKDCAVIEAVACGRIAKSRYESYCRMYQEVKDIRDWQLKPKNGGNLNK